MCILKGKDWYVSIKNELIRMQYNSCNIQLYSMKTPGYKTGSVIRYIGAIIVSKLHSSSSQRRQVGDLILSGNSNDGFWLVHFKGKQLDSIQARMSLL